MSLKKMAAKAVVWLRLAKDAARPPGKLPKHISERLARDIGMSRAELERHRFVLPSQSADRPLI